MLHDTRMHNIDITDDAQINAVFSHLFITDVTVAIQQVFYFANLSLYFQKIHHFLTLP